MDSIDFFQNFCVSLNPYSFDNWIETINNILTASFKINELFYISIYVSHSTSFILHYILDILAQNGLRKNSALINNNAVSIFIPIGNEIWPIPRYRQKKNSSQLITLIWIFEWKILRKKEKRMEKKRGEGIKKKRYKYKNCPGGGWNERCSPTCSFGMNNVASGTSG